MAEVWLIDGYNVLCAQHEQQDVVSLSHARDRLIDRLSDFAAMMNIRLILVFDAHKVKGGTRSAVEMAGLKVVYTKAEETADQYIERTCAILKEQGEVVRVCTNDGMEQHVILGLGGLRMSVRKLMEQMQKAVVQRQKLQAPKARQYLFKRLDEDIRTKLDRVRTEE